jgi:transposase-like protein
MRKHRKHVTPTEKVAIFRRHLIEKVPVSDLCDQYQIQPAVFYAWQRQLFENGIAAFERRNRAAEAGYQRAIAALRVKLRRKDEVVYELMEEHLRLKKSLGDP